MSIAFSNFRKYLFSSQSRVLRRPLWSWLSRGVSWVLNVALKKMGSLLKQEKLRCHIYWPRNWFRSASPSPTEWTWFAYVLANSTLSGPTSGLSFLDWEGEAGLCHRPPPPPPVRESHGQGEAGTGSTLLAQPLHHYPSHLALVLEQSSRDTPCELQLLKDPTGSCWRSLGNFHWKNTATEYSSWDWFGDSGVKRQRLGSAHSDARFRAGHTHNPWASL